MPACARPKCALFAVIAAAVFLGTWHRLPGAQPAESSGEAGKDDRSEALHALLTERESDQALETRIGRAEQLGVPRQAILEARFLYHVDRGEDEDLAALLPRLLEQNQRFKLSESEIFAFEEDWLAVLEYVRAIDALLRDDTAAFKEHITEAFWLSPQQGAAYATHIEKFRRRQAMRAARVDFTRPLSSLEGEDVRLADALNAKPAMLLHFFSPWSRESAETMEDFAATARALGKAGIPVATILGEADPRAVEDTAQLLREQPEPPPGLWLVDHSESSLAHRLRIRTTPTMALVSKDGSIRFSGHPREPALWEAIREIAPGFARPSAPGWAGPPER